MADLRELTTDAKRLYEALDYLLEKQDNANKDDIDLKEIWFSAKARPFQGHLISTLEEFEARRHLLVLSSLIALTENSEKRTIQIRFLARILASCKNVTLELQALVADGKLMQTELLDKLQEISNEGMKVSLLIDLLLMVYLDGEAEERQMDYVIGMMAWMGFDKTKTTAIATIVKGILEQDDAVVLKQNNYISIQGTTCYLKNPMDGVLVNDLTEAKTVQAKKVIFYGAKWTAIPMIQIDEYQAEIIEFRNCVFTGIQGIFNKTKKVILENCSFKDCKVEENLLCMKNAVINQCKFDGISALDAKTKHLIVLVDSQLRNTEFVNILIQYHKNSGGGFIKTRNCEMMNILVEKLTTESKDCYPKYVIDIYAGRILDCKLIDCSLAYGNSYFITLNDNVIEQNICVKNFNLENYGIHWKNPNNLDHRNSIDASFEAMFGGN